VSVRKLMSDLSPAVLDQLGFSGAVRRLMTRFGEPEGGHARLHLGDLPPMDRRIETMLYRFLQECLANISRHSAAKNINVSLTASDTEVRLSVEDDGVGFDAADGTIRRNRFGLAGMRERVMLLGGKFSVIAVPASRVKLGISPGTRIVIKLPFIGIFQD
jgi:signal transduction histidine kinase